MKRKSVISLVLVGLLACLVGCNSNPVAATSGSDTLLGYSQSGRLAEENAVDILWVVDNSGSMGDEQVALINQFKKFVTQMINIGIDFQMAVTTTDTRGSNRGELNNVPKPIPGGLAWGSFAIDPLTGDPYQEEGDWSEAAAESFFNASVAAWKCVKNESEMPKTKEQLKTLRDGIAGAVKANVGNKNIGSGSGSPFAQFFPTPDKYKSFEKIIKSSAYDLDSEKGRQDLVTDFSCIAMVGTEGYGIEKGLLGMLSATEPNKNQGFIRQLAKFSVVFVSDENDCTHFAVGSKDFDENSCLSKVCNMFNAEGIPASINPLLSVEEAKTKLLNNLSTVKGVTFDEDKVIVAAITGTPSREVLGDGEIGFTKQLADIENNFLNAQQYPEDSPVCQGVPYADINKPKTFGPKSNTCLRINGRTENVAMSGDRYNRFADLFSNHFPAKGKGKDGGEGVICFGTFGEAIDTIAKLFQDTSSGCITQKLLGADECSATGVKEGEPCGVEGQGGECKELSNDEEQLYCTSAVQVVLVSPNPLSEQVITKYCQNGEAGNVSGMSNACVFARDKYDFVQCPLKVKGLKFQIKNLEQVKQDLVGVDVKVFYTAYAPEDEEVDATNTNQTQQ